MNNEFEILYNLYRVYTKKELKNILKFLKDTQKRVKKYAKRKDLKIEEYNCMDINNTKVLIHITNIGSVDYIKTREPGNLEIAVQFIGSMSIKKINQSNDIEFKSRDNSYGGMGLIDFDEFIIQFSNWVNKYIEPDDESVI